MAHYAERRPPPAVRGLLTCVWARSVVSAGAETRVVPDACVDVIWERETGRLFVAGPDTRPHLARISVGEFVGARFHRGHSPVGLGVPAAALRDQRPELDQLWASSRVRRLAEELAATGSAEQAQEVLSTAVLDGAREPADPAVPTLLRLAGDGLRVGEMADSIGLTERQLHRRCLASFGYGPKVLQRVLRFDAAVRLARTGAGLADVAYSAGYADQAHLSREVRALAGVPLTVLLG
jgi:AraC-like DNA-binding protein